MLIFASYLKNEVGFLHISAATLMMHRYVLPLVLINFFFFLKTTKTV